MMFLYYTQQTLKLALLATLILFCLRTFIAEPGRINGRSMEPTFYDEDLFFVDKISLFFREPQRGDIVQFETPSERHLAVKRVIAIAGDKLEIRKDGIYLQKKGEEWEKLDEPYLHENIVTKGSLDEIQVTFLEIPEFSYFLMGDNRPMSGDSRSYGAVHRTRIFGLVKNVSLFNQ